MDPASAAGVAVSALASVAADAAIGSRLRVFLADRRRKRALTRVIEQAYSTFARNHPDIAASFFDPVFLERREVSQELARVLTLDDVPNPDVLAQCYAGQFSYRLADEAKEAINDFMTSFNIELEREQGLADLFTHRLTRLSYRLTRSTYEEVSALREELRLGQSPRPMRLSGPEASDGGKHPETSQGPFDIDAVSEVFGAASRLLLSWPQETDGHWIERPELEQLHALALRPECAITVLLSEAGGGKSALLARLGNRLAAEGVILLAIKADQLPRGMGHLDDFDRWVGAPVSVAEALRGLAKERRVVLLIDQLDALAELMDQHSQRLSVLLRLVSTVRDVSNLQIVLSCREFEYRNDIRLATLGAEPIRLVPPNWEQIAPLVVARGIDPTGWSEEVQEVLRTPQHLAIFLNHLADHRVPAFSSYQALLEQVVRQLERDCGPRAVEAAEQIAKAMGEEEELFLGSARFDRAWREELVRLEAAGILIYSGDRFSLTFRHQTLFEFLRSRAFLRDHTSVADYVIREKQESLFVRPLLWSTLHYLRGADRGTYRREFGRLWSYSGLRQHLRYLLVAYLGQLRDPDDQEARWLLPTLDTPKLRRNTLFAMGGSPGWFMRLSGRLATLMTAPPETAWDTVGLLHRALEFERDTALALIERYWLPQPEYNVLTLRAIDNDKAWDERSVELAARVVERGNVAPMYVRHLAESISRSQPNLASTVLVRWLEMKLNETIANQEPPPEPPPEGVPDDEQLRWQIRCSRATHAPFERLLERSTDWHDLDRIAVLAPKMFIDRIWPWLLRVLARLGEEADLVRYEYRSHRGLAFAHADGERSPGASLPNAIEAASCAFAEADPDSYLAFVRTNEGLDLMAVHHLLAIGLERLADIRPNAVLDYLLADPRRFAVGDFYDLHRDSRRLIAAVAPNLSPSDRLRLEEAIIGRSHYRAFPAGEDAKTRFDRRKSARRHRLRLLRAFPAQHLSQKGRRLLLEEERALPHTFNYDAGTVSVSWVGSPMTAAQMAAASDDNIVGLFEELVDATQWDHPRRRWTKRHGGSVPAAREFAAFAKNHPERALRILERFQPGLQERPVGEAVAVLGESEAVSAARLVEKIRTLSLRGFTSQEFRWHAARSLRALALREQGLDDATCELLEGWLSEWEPPQPAADNDELAGTHRHQTSEQSEDQTDSLLWGHGRSVVLPGGNHPILEALTCGYLLRDPMAADQWLNVLQRHLSRREDPAVWQALAYNLRFLANAELGSALAFLERLFETQPSVLTEERGVMLIARIHDWLPAGMFARVIDGWITCGWSRGPQAAGEVATLRLCQRPEESEARELVESFIAGCDYDPFAAARLRLGIGHTLVQAWSEPPLRALSTPLLLRLLPFPDEPVTDALHLIFAKADPLPTDNHTRILLQSLLSCPGAIVSHEPTFLVDRLKDLLRQGWELDLVCDVVAAILDHAGAKLNDLQGGWPGQARELVEIALTLHRMPETRARGLDLFEQLMNLDAYGVTDHLRILDRRPFR